MVFLGKRFFLGYSFGETIHGRRWFFSMQLGSTSLVKEEKKVGPSLWVKTQIGGQFGLL
jgi:hypothetical protein